MSDTPIMDAYPTSVIEREIHFALNPVGMSVHSGNVTLPCSHIHNVLARGRDLELKLAAERKRADDAEKDAKRYRLFRLQNRAGMPLIVDPFKAEVGYTPEGLDIALDFYL